MSLGVGSDFSSRPVSSSTSECCFPGGSTGVASGVAVWWLDEKSVDGVALSGSD